MATNITPEQNRQLNLRRLSQKLNTWIGLFAGLFVVHLLIGCIANPNVLGDGPLGDIAAAVNEFFAKSFALSADDFIHKTVKYQIVSFWESLSSFPMSLLKSVIPLGFVSTVFAKLITYHFIKHKDARPPDIGKVFQGVQHSCEQVKTITPGVSGLCENIANQRAEALAEFQTSFRPLSIDGGLVVRSNNKCDRFLQWDESNRIVIDGVGKKGCLQAYLLNGQAYLYCDDDEDYAFKVGEPLALLRRENEKIIASAYIFWLGLGG